MPFEDCAAAMRLEMPPRVPRTEYSLEMHTPLINRVTGSRLTDESSPVERESAISAFKTAWDYSFLWSTNLYTQYFGAWQTNMGHAIYDEGGKDWNDALRCPFRDADQVLRFQPSACFQLPTESALTETLSAEYRRCRDMQPRQVSMVGTYTTGISAMIAIFGWDLLLEAAGEDYDAFGRLLWRYGDWAMPYYRALAACESPYIMIHDDMVWAEGGFLPPAWYRKYLFPLYRRYLSPLLEAGKTVTFTSDGNYTEYLPDLAQCGFHGFVLEPLTDLKAIVDGFGKTHYFIGNVDTRVLLMGSREEIRREVERCFTLAKHCPGFIFATGNHIPPNTPVESCLYYNECYMKLRDR